MSTYYVSATGSNANNGTATGTPWQTVAYALTTALAGDTILLKGGDTFAESVSTSKALTVGSYGTGLGIINGGTGKALSFIDVGGFTVNGIKLIANSTVSHCLFIQNTGSTKLAAFTVTNCE